MRKQTDTAIPSNFSSLSFQISQLIIPILILPLCKQTFPKSITTTNAHHTTAYVNQAGRHTEQTDSFSHSTAVLRLDIHRQTLSLSLSLSNDCSLITCAAKVAQQQQTINQFAVEWELLLQLFFCGCCYDFENLFALVFATDKVSPLERVREEKIIS